MTKLNILTALLLTWSFSGHASSDPIEGKWQTPERATLVEITQSMDGQWQGIVVESEAKQALGIQVLSSVEKDEKAYKGKIYAVKANKHFDAHIAFNDDDTLLISVNAGFFSKNVIWNRVK